MARAENETARPAEEQGARAPKLLASMTVGRLHNKKYKCTTTHKKARPGGEGFGERATLARQGLEGGLRRPSSGRDLGLVVITMATHPRIVEATFEHRRLVTLAKMRRCCRPTGWSPSWSSSVRFWCRTRSQGREEDGLVICAFPRTRTPLRAALTLDVR